MLREVRRELQTAAGFKKPDACVHAVLLLLPCVCMSIQGGREKSVKCVHACMCTVQYVLCVHECACKEWWRAALESRGVREKCMHMCRNQRPKET